MNKLKRDDEVIIVTGKDKGKRGSITRILDNDRVVVAGINMVKRHTKANPNAGRLAALLRKKHQFMFQTLRFLTRRRIKRIAQRFR